MRDDRVETILFQIIEKSYVCKVNIGKTVKKKRKSEN